MGVGMALGLYDAAFATLAGIYGREARGVNGCENPGKDGGKA
jgi:hypothetical protein